MNRKIAVIVLLLTLVILAGAPESFARPQYFTALTAVYGDGSCGTCHVNPSGGGPRNSYGMLFESQSNHRADPGAALTAIGSPFSSTATPLITPTDTMTPAPTETPFDTVTPPVTTVTPAGTPATPGFGIVVSLIGLFACALLARRRNK
jgi:PGF-CTERM protein